MSVVILALVVLSRLQPVPKIFLISWWMDLSRECGFESSAI